MRILTRREFSVTGIAYRYPIKTARHIATRMGEESTGVSGNRDEPIGDSLGELMKGLAVPASMAANLALVENQ